MDLFKDIIYSITTGGENLLTSENEKEYKSYVVNMAMSMQPDCLLFGNEMNINHHIDNKLQYDYLLNTIRKYKRPHFWAKRKKNDTKDNIDVIIEYYECGKDQAKDILNILTDDQLEDIIRTIQKGGLNNG